VGRLRYVRLQAYFFFANVLSERPQFSLVLRDSLSHGSSQTPRALRIEARKRAVRTGEGLISLGRVQRTLCPFGVAGIVAFALFAM